MSDEAASGALRSARAPRIIRSLRGRVFFATLAASIVAVGIALAIGVFTTRSAVQESNRQEVAREARVIAAQIDSISSAREARSKRSGPAGRDAQEAPENLGSLLRDSSRPDAPATGDRRGRRPGGGASGELGPPPLGGPPPGPGFSARPGSARRPAPPRVVPIADADELLPSDRVAELKRGSEAIGTMQLHGREVNFAAVPIVERGVFVLATRPQAVSIDDYSEYLTGLILAALIAAALSAAVASQLARRITKPIDEVVAASVALAAGETPVKIAEPAIAELDELARSFNGMVDRLARAREAERTVLMSASHELRTPLTAISGYAEAIEDGTVDPAVGSRVIVSESSRLERLVQDLLVLARLDQGTFETHLEPVDLAKITATARDRLALRAEAAGVELVAESTPPAEAIADFDRVLQIVTNLVDNAVRVTPSGGRVSVVASKGAVVVVDDGPGIPAEDLPHVFERFHLRRQRGMGSPDGSGIGLAITRELAGAMGGSVAVISTLGEGATFTVTLPTK